MKIFSKRLLSKTKKWVIPSIGVLALVIFSSLILFEATKATVDITQNGEKITVKTHSSTVGDLIEELELVVGEHDAFSHDMDEAIKNNMAINHEEAKLVYVAIDDVKTEFHTTAATIEAFLNDEELEFTEHDEVSFKYDDAITDGLHITVTQAYQITIDDAGEETKVWTTGGNVAELLEDQDIVLKKIDKIEPKEDAELSKGTAIKITRVEKAEDTVEQRVTFETERKADSTLAKGKEKVVFAGEEGALLKTFEVTMENGEEVNRELINEEIIKEKKNKIIAVGTKEVPKQNLVTLSSKNSGKSASKKTTGSSEPKGKELYMTATAYTADCNGCSGITATGINLKANRNLKVIAVDPNVIPLGSTVWVEGYGTAIAGDKGGSIKGNRIDVHVPSHAEAMRFGFKKVKVKVIK